MQALKSGQFPSNSTEKDGKTSEASFQEKLGTEFTNWFFAQLNSEGEKLGHQHFFPNCHLRVSILHFLDSVLIFIYVKNLCVASKEVITARWFLRICENLRKFEKIWSYMKSDWVELGWLKQQVIKTKNRVLEIPMLLMAYDISVVAQLHISWHVFFPHCHSLGTLGLLDYPTLAFSGRHVHVEQWDIEHHIL